MNGKWHLLKCEQPHFDNLKAGIKTLELRKNDRNYQVGDGLILTLYDWQKKEYGHDQLVTEITHTIQDETWLQPGCIALSIKPPICIPIFITPELR